MMIDSPRNICLFPILICFLFFPSKPSIVLLLVDDFYVYILLALPYRFLFSDASYWETIDHSSRLSNKSNFLHHHEHLPYTDVRIYVRERTEEQNQKKIVV